MNSETIIATQVTLEANKDCVFSPEGRLVAKLPPKRRFKACAVQARARNWDSQREETGRSFYPFKKSGHPHQLWKTKSSTLVTKIGFNETISDGIGRFVSHLHLAQAR